MKFGYVKCLLQANSYTTEEKFKMELDKLGAQSFVWKLFCHRMPAEIVKKTMGDLEKGGLPDYESDYIKAGG